MDSLMSGAIGMEARPDSNASRCNHKARPLGELRTFLVGVGLCCWEPAAFFTYL